MELRSTLIGSFLSNGFLAAINGGLVYAGTLYDPAIDEKLTIPYYLLMTFVLLRASLFGFTAVVSLVTLATGNITIELTGLINTFAKGVMYT